MLQNIPQVTKNLLILNILMFLLSLYFESQGTDISHILGGHYLNSAGFKPYQIISHMFMHGDFLHIFFNMFALVMFGGFLEKLWGAKRFFIFYFASAFGAFLLYNSIGIYQLYEIKSHMSQELLAYTESIIKHASSRHQAANEIITHLMSNPAQAQISALEISDYLEKSLTPMIGASGAIFGIMAAFAILFPNTELMLLFPPIPIKAKFLIGGYFIYEVYRSIYEVAGDNVAHLAHVGGAVVGAILVLIWRRQRNNFY